ncbi:beta-lactamase hydrolase domain-containing protein [Sinimarinibacterium thermocellulolyticum]|uniref:Sulfur transferase domain-containing protein n=1 Tax=Sinimarinibacterium thermocellulolyticum TaxID=3170016 RepID=A0ABV2ABW6_9GAMM
MPAPIRLDIPFFAAPSEKVLTGGKTSPEALRQAQAQGVAKIVNLCPPSEDLGFDEPALAAALGLAYENIPVAGGADLTRENAQRLADAIASAPGPVLVHCMSSNRVGALFALKAHWLDGKSVDAAIAEGRAHGLKAMEAGVRQLLER